MPELMDTQLLNGRQRVAAASLLKKRPALLPDDGLYQLWYELVCSEMRRLGIVQPSQIEEFCDRAGVPTKTAVPLTAQPSDLIASAI